MSDASVTAFANLLPSFAAAVGAGLLIGIERERRKGSGANRQFAGVRTFTMAAVMGAIGQSLAHPWLVPLGGTLILVLSAIGYARDRSGDPGITTELALFVTYLLGVLAIDEPRSAAASAVVVAALLYARQGLHRFSTELLSPAELRDALLLGGAALVVLPMVPSTPLAWLGGLDPRRLWALAVMFMTIQGLGYVALRAFGPRVGLAFGGLMSGFVSSAATTGALGARARETPALLPSCVAGAWLSTVATALQLLLITSTIHPASLVTLRAPLLVMLASALSCALLALARQHERAAPLPTAGRAFNLAGSLGFAALLAGVTAVVGLIESRYGLAGAGIGIAIAGFADAHSAATSALSLANSGAVAPAAIGHYVLLAVTTNTVTKAVLAFTSGGTRYGAPVTAGLVAITGAAWLALLA